MHIHTAPDVQKRTVDDIEAAAEAREVGMKAILLKGKHVPTTARAIITEKFVPGIRVFGSLCLDSPMGGINPSAVEVAIKMGAKEIFMPTFSARNHNAYYKMKDIGISILDDEDKLLPEIYEILDLIAASDIILGTGHISVQETLKLVNEADKRGVKKIVVTHPELPAVNMDNVTQLKIRKKVFFERLFVSTLLVGGNIPFERIVKEIKEVGIERTIIATDFGVTGIPHPVKGMEMYLNKLIKAGFSNKELSIMGEINPGKMLGIDNN
jgi:methylmalonyl-CoA mutase cobalamin-binding subunit